MDLQLIKRNLEGLPRGQRRGYIERIARTHGVSADTVYRELRKQYGKRKSLAREKNIPDEWIDWIAQLKAESIRYGHKDRELATKRCIRILERSGKIPRGVLTVSTANRRLEESGLRQRKIAVRYEAQYANQAHQIDFSRSEYAELIDYDAARGDYLVMINQRGLSYKNKDGKKQRLWLAQVIDEYSRVRLVRYFAAANEDSLMGLEMMHFCWRRENDNHPLIYVPYHLRTDNGSFAKSEFTQNMLDRLDIAWLPSTVGNKRSMGKVERGWRTWWQWELETAMVIGEKNVIYLSELNNLAQAECVRELTERHPTRRGFRGDLYMRSLASHEQAQRRLEADVIDLATRVVQRTVNINDCRVRFGNDLYTAPDKYAGRVIRVVMNPAGQLIGEAIDLGERFELKLQQPLEFGEYKAKPDTYSERMGKAFDREIIGEQKPAGLDDVSGNNRIYMPANEEKLKPETPMQATKTTAFANADEAREYIGKRLGIPYNRVAETFDELLNITLDRAVIDGILKDAI